MYIVKLIYVNISIKNFIRLKRLIDRTLYEPGTITLLDSHSYHIQNINMNNGKRRINNFSFTTTIKSH